ncbi:hypothetical protein MHYP_G00177080 [Metynnis hypsauchen]
MLDVFLFSLSGYTGPPVRSGGGSRTWLCKAICGHAQSFFSAPATRHAAATHQAVLRPHKQQLTSGTIAACTGTLLPASKAHRERKSHSPEGPANVRPLSYRSSEWKRTLTAF